MKAQVIALLLISLTVVICDDSLLQTTYKDEPLKVETFKDWFTALQNMQSVEDENWTTVRDKYIESAACEEEKTITAEGFKQFITDMCEAYKLEEEKSTDSCDAMEDNLPTEDSSEE